MSGDVGVAQGRENVFHETLRHLSRHWERIDVLCPRAPGAAERRPHANVAVHPSPWPRALQPLFVLRRGGEIACERRYALIVSHDYGVFYNGIGAWLLSRRLRVPYVSELHHVEGYPRAASARETLYRRLAHAYIRFAARRAAAFRTVNRDEVPPLLRRLGVPEEKILVLPSLYLDLDVFRPLPEVQKELDVLLVGRLVPNKRVETLLEALALLRPAHRSLSARVLGDGPLRPRLERRIDELGLRGHVSIVPGLASARGVARLYNSARILVCASSAEGGPRVVVEAMACGVPVVSTPVGIVRELVRDGENGLLFRWEAAELAAKIDLLLGDDELRARIGEAGRRTAAAFDAETAIARYSDALRALATSARPSS